MKIYYWWIDCCSCKRGRLGYYYLLLFIFRSGLWFLYFKIVFLCDFYVLWFLGLYFWMFGIGISFVFDFWRMYCIFECKFNCGLISFEGFELEVYYNLEEVSWGGINEFGEEELVVGGSCEFGCLLINLLLFLIWIVCVEFY